MKAQDKEALSTWLRALEEFPHEGVRRDLEVVQFVVAALTEGKTGQLQLSQDCVGGHTYWLDFDNATLSIDIGMVNFEWNPFTGAELFIYKCPEAGNPKYTEWARRYNVPVHYIPDKTK